MPTYEYRCKACGENLEVFQAFTDDPLTTCPECAGELRKVFSPVGIAFKGSGFYKTDSRTAAKSGSSSSDSKDSKAAEKSDAKSSDSKTSDSKTSDSKSSESKPSTSKSSESKSPSSSTAAAS